MLNTNFVYKGINLNYVNYDKNGSLFPFKIINAFNKTQLLERVFTQT